MLPYILAIQFLFPTIHADHSIMIPKARHRLCNVVCLYVCVCLSARLIIPPRASAVVQGYILASSNSQGQRASLWSRLRLLASLSYWSAALQKIPHEEKSEQSRVEGFWRGFLSLPRGESNMNYSRFAPPEKKKHKRLHGGEVKRGWGAV